MKGNSPLCAAAPIPVGVRWFAFALAGLTACARVESPTPRSLASARTAAPAGSVAAESKPADAPAPPRSHFLATIARRSIGPFAALAKDGGLAAWIVAGDGGGQADLIVVPFGVDGAPVCDARVIAAVPRESTSLLVRPMTGGHAGWLVVWSAIRDRGESLTMLALSRDGTALGGPIDLERTSDHVTWMDLVPTDRGALCVWAEDTAGGDANMLAAPVDPDGAPRGVPVRVARGIERWAASRAGPGAALALVTRDTGSPAGRLSWLRLDADGNAVGVPVSVSKEPTVSGDIDLVPARDGWLLAWTDRTGEDPQVSLALVDAEGRIRGPTRAMDAVGGSSLVALAAGPAGVALAWESPHVRTRPWSLLHLASVVSGGTGLAAQPVTSFEVEARAPRELIATDDGFAVLTTPVPECQSSSPRATISAGDCVAVPMFLRYDARLTPVQAEPLLVGKPQAPATLAWGLLGGGDRSLALASTSDAPTPVFAVDLPRRKSPFEAPGTVAPPSGEVARATGIVTIESGRPYIDVAATRVGDATLVATMATAEATAADRPRDRGEAIRVRAFDAQGRAIDTESTLTSRAVAVGRIAIAAAPQPEGGAAAAWVARHDTGAEVHVAHLDAHGHRIKEVPITTAKWDASNVAISWAGDGWMIAWVDWRDGNGEVYAAKVDRNLNRVTPDQRITRAPGDAADVSLAVSGDVAWLAWSDPRESPREGVADVYVALLRSRDARPKGDEVRVLATAAHSRSPEIVAVDEGALVAWIEDAPTGLDAPGAAMFARLDSRGRVVGSPRPLLLGGEGRPTAVVLAPSPLGAQAIIARSGPDWVTLDALEVPGGGPAGPAWPLVDLDAPAPFDVALALVGGALVYDDTGSAAGRRRMRRLTIAW